jgi:hypothetical protein
MSATGNGPNVNNFLPTIPHNILRRHGARVLDPTTASVAPSSRVPLPTMYRAGTLLLYPPPEDHKMLIRRMRGALRKIGLQMTLPAQESSGEPAKKPWWKNLWRKTADPWQAVSDIGPHLVMLTAIRRRREPATVDAWEALQHLSASRPELAQHVGLEHMLFASQYTWSGVEGAYTPSNPGGTAAVASYVRSRSEGRLPVVLYMAEPPPRTRLTSTTLRRPVVAVLDTGFVEHPWLKGDEGGPFIVGDLRLQGDIAKHGGPAATTGGLTSFEEQPMSPAETLLGELDSHWGHGTFIAGIIRQAAPNARVLAVRVMYSDGVAHEGDVLFALKQIIARVRQAQSEGGDPDGMVDVVSLSLGYYPEDDRPEKQAVTACIDQLLAMGVLVVAAAGNDATTRRFYPAALARREPILPAAGGSPTSLPQQLVSVGSLNPNGSKAIFSNDDPNPVGWVTQWAPGASVVSTFPQTRTGSITPVNSLDAQPPDDRLPHRREALDEDDFYSGFAVWNGTSFAAPMVAARLAESLFKDAHEAQNADASASAAYPDKSPSVTNANPSASVAKTDVWTAAATGAPSSVPSGGPPEGGPSEAGHGVNRDDTLAAAKRAVGNLGKFVWPQTYRGRRERG